MRLHAEQGYEKSPTGWRFVITKTATGCPVHAELVALEPDQDADPGLTAWLSPSSRKATENSRSSPQPHVRRPTSIETEPQQRYPLKGFVRRFPSLHTSSPSASFPCTESFWIDGKVSDAFAGANALSVESQSSSHPTIPILFANIAKNCNLAPKNVLRYSAVRGG